MIRKIYILLMILGLPLFAEAQDLRLKVVDKDNNPMSGVVVIPRNQYKTGVFTDEDGIAELNNSLKGRQVEVIDYGSFHKVVTLQEDMTTVKIDNNSSIVGLGYNIYSRNEDLTSSVSTVGFDEVETSLNNPANALYGKLSGLYVMQGESVAWSNSPKLFVRGIGTLNNTEPLILIDGYERSLKSISVEEIESISVLKDAGALALYGMRGANGVVLVTTKRGEAKGMHAKISYNFGMDTPFRMPDMADAYHYAKAVNEAMVYDGMPAKYSAAELQDFYSGNSPELYPNVNWRDEIVRKMGYSHDFSLSFRGGAKAVRYYSQISYNGNNGLIRPHDMSPEYSSQMEWDRLSVRTNLDIDITTSTFFQINIMGQVEQNHRPSIMPDPLFEMIYNTPAAVFPVKTSNGFWGADNLRNNPMAELTAKGYTDGVDRALFADMRLTQNLSALTKGLSVDLSVAFDNSASFWEGQGRKYTSEVLHVHRTPDGTVSEVDRTVIGADTPLSYSSEVGQASSITTFDGNIRYDRIFRDLHAVRAMVGYHMEGSIRNGRNNTYRRQSVLGTVHYGYDSRYLIDITASYAGSSVMKRGDKFRFFPAISAAWVLSNENFLKDSKVVNLLKIRASYGVTGSDMIPYGLGYQYYGGKGSYYFGNNNTMLWGNGEGTLANKDLTCEMSYKANVGFDMRLLEKLDLTVDFFHEDRKNILCSTQNVYSGALGIPMADVNDGHVRNTGVDAGLVWRHTVGDWSYWLGGTFTFSRNKIVNMNEGFVPYSYLSRTGGRVGQFFGLQAVGFFDNQQEINSASEHTFSKVRPGDLRYNDLNGDHKVDSYDMTAIGYSTAIPEIYYGFNLGFSWKGLSLSADFQGVTNYTVLKNMSSFYQPLKNNTNVSYHYLANRWTTSNQHDAKYPRLSTLENKNNYQSSSVWQEDGSYLKLRMLELAWILPKRWSMGIRSSEIRFFARGFNLFSLDYVKALDPEIMYASYPSLRSYHIGVNINF